MVFRHLGPYPGRDGTPPEAVEPTPVPQRDPQAVGEPVTINGGACHAEPGCTNAPAGYLWMEWPTGPTVPACTEHLNGALRRGGRWLEVAGGRVVGVRAGEVAFFRAATPPV